MIKISVVIPMYNCGPYIGRCLESVESQGLEEDELEVIVIDDLSTDNTVSIAQKMGAKVIINEIFQFSNNNS